MKIENIKFKAKRLDNGEWVEGSLTYFNGIAYIHHKESDEDDRCYLTPYEVNPDTVCQFIGLTDCEGNELFEHDLIHFLGFWHTAEMIWSEDNYSFMAVCENTHFYFLRDILRVSKIEIIGNKFDKEK